MTEGVKQPPEGKGCGNCRFYLAGTVGHCNRYPPQILYAYEHKHPDDYRVIFPTVDADDWCGEWVSIAGPGEVEPSGR